MSLETRIVALLGVAGITNLVGDRVFAVEAPQDTLAPFIVWQRVSTSFEHTHDGNDAGYVLIQIAAYATKFADAVSIRAAVQTAMSNGDASGPVIFRDNRDTKERERNVYRCDTDLDFWNQ